MQHVGLGSKQNKILSELGSNNLSRSFVNQQINLILIQYPQCNCTLMNTEDTKH